MGSGHCRPVKYGRRSPFVTRRAFSIVLSRRRCSGLRLSERPIRPFHLIGLTSTSITDLGAFGYYLEHLNIIAGLSCALGDREYAEVNVRISAHLNEMSLTQDNTHARLLPHVKMRWSADQAAILKSLWLCDQNHGTDFHTKPAENWLAFMSENMTDPETGLFQTEVMRVKRYSRQPRGCALAYMAHYLESFAPEVASHQWKLFKRAMLKTRLGLTGFREYLPSYAGKWTPDSGPIVGGVGIAATGLGLKAARTLSDPEAYGILKRSVDRALLGIRLIKFVLALGLSLHWDRSFSERHIL